MLKNLDLSPLDNKILKCVRDYKNGVTREILNKLLNIPWTTLYQHLEKLEHRKLIKRFPLYEGKQGRPKVMWQQKRFKIFN